MPHNDILNTSMNLGQTVFEQVKPISDSMPKYIQPTDNVIKA